MPDFIGGRVRQHYPMRYCWKPGYFSICHKSGACGQVPNGELSAAQLRFLAGCIEPYGEKGCADITTRANLQLRGLTLAEADQIMEARTRLLNAVELAEALLDA